MAPNPISWCRRSRKPPAASGPRRLLSSAQQTRLRALPLGELETFADTRLDVHGSDDLNAWLTVDDFTSSVANHESFGHGRQEGRQKGRQEGQQAAAAASALPPAPPPLRHPQLGRIDPHPSPSPRRSRNPRRGPARCPRTCRAQPLTGRQRRAKCDANRLTHPRQRRIASMIFGSRACDQRNQSLLPPKAAIRPILAKVLFCFRNIAIPLLSPQ